MPCQKSHSNKWQSKDLHPGLPGSQAGAFNHRGENARCHCIATTWLDHPACWVWEEFKRQNTNVVLLYLPIAFPGTPAANKNYCYHYYLLLLPLVTENRVLLAIVRGFCKNLFSSFHRWGKSKFREANHLPQVTLAYKVKTNLEPNTDSTQNMLLEIWMLESSPH